MTVIKTISTSLLGLALVAASTPSHALSLSSVLHLHPHVAAAAAQQAQLKVQNPNSIFRDIEVVGRTYTIRPQQSLTITAPVGTPIYAADKMFRKHAKGSVIAQVESGSRTVVID